MLLLFIISTVCQTLQIGGLDMVFVLDASGSIGSVNFERMKQTIEDIVSQLTIGPTTTRVAVVVFASSASLIFNLNRYTEKEALIEAIRDLQYTDGGTNTADALALLRLNVFAEILGVRPLNESTRVAIVITDGHSNDRDATRREAEQLRNSAQFTVYAIGIGGGVGIQELINIAGNNNTVIQVENFNVEQLQELERELTREACRCTYVHVATYCIYIIYNLMCSSYSSVCIYVHIHVHMYRVYVCIHMHL